MTIRDGWLIRFKDGSKKYYGRDVSYSSKMLCKKNDPNTRIIATYRDDTIEKIVILYCKETRNSYEVYDRAEEISININALKTSEEEIKKIVYNKVKDDEIYQEIIKQLLEHKRNREEYKEYKYKRTLTTKEDFPEQIKSYTSMHPNTYDESKWEVYLNGEKKDKITREDVNPGDHIEERVDGSLFEEWRII